MIAKEKLKELSIYGRKLSDLLLPDQIQFIEKAMEEYAKATNDSKPVSCLNCRHWEKVVIGSIYGLCNCEKTQDALGASPIETKHDFSCKYSEIFY